MMEIVGRICGHCECDHYRAVFLWRLQPLEQGVWFVVWSVECFVTKVISTSCDGHSYALFVFLCWVLGSASLSVDRFVRFVA